MYKVGDKVETRLGIGVIEKVTEYPKGYDNSYHVSVNVCKEKLIMIYEEDELKPYKSQHEKLIEMGYSFSELINYMRRYENEYDDENIPVEIIIDYKHKNYYIPENDVVNLELSRILTQYLEELEESR